ncbi:MAG: tRNA (adenosine(37)-N6)-threonylcarbamoyltransferase complex ATPase subunit type 1 TsaE [Bacilli bacterium]|nr:tRNA (adenosine(37)-N6)-threonylcarbamoyltransferase complex ATPase subunit type 1 TsaE [Acholeplasmataceae bacterium]MDY2902484.1 tRNA (adenosine(37)-N6)-threonylcarbamoyltransferase complex ATPase subunit type 1 TsaE [Bacilli bacterium]
MVKEIIIKSPKEMIELGEKLGTVAFPNMLITMLGDLGAGKTTMTKGIAKGLGINGVVNSPTFTIMKIYEGRLKLYHLDVYRIENPLDDFELEEYFEDDGVCVIEWANQINELLPHDRLDIEILDLGNDKRKVILKSSSIIYDNIISEVTK